MANIFKLFTVVSYDFSKKARAFVPGKPFQPSVMFAGKACFEGKEQDRRRRRRRIERERD